jgi:hypothetical protein
MLQLYPVIHGDRSNQPNLRLFKIAMARARTHVDFDQRLAGIEEPVKEIALFPLGPLIASSHGRRRCYDADE